MYHPWYISPLLTPSSWPVYHPPDLCAWSIIHISSPNCCHCGSHWSAMYSTLLLDQLWYNDTLFMKILFQYCSRHKPDKYIYIRYMYIDSLDILILPLPNSTEIRMYCTTGSAIKKDSKCSVMVYVWLNESQPIDWFIGSTMATFSVKMHWSVNHELCTPLTAFISRQFIIIILLGLLELSI